MDKMKEEILKDLDELREYIKNPSTYENYYSTTKKGMGEIFIDQIKDKVKQLCK